MATGNLEIQITDMAGNPLGSKVFIELAPLSGELGSGGEKVELSFNMGTATELTITKIPCRGGPGTMYRLLATADHFRPYSFQQLITESASNIAGDDVEFLVKPGDVKDITAPEFDGLPPNLRTMLTNAEMVAEKPEDRDLTGKAGLELYRNLGPMRTACLLNIAKKASHETSDKCFPQFGRLLVCRQDRLFAMISDASLPDRLRLSRRYKTAPNKLHEPIAGFEMMPGQSFKTDDAHANLQVTFQRRKDTGELAADIDIDESSGIKHGLEVLGNAVFRKRTNPYLIREFLLRAEPFERTLDPGYRFLF